MKGGTGEKKKKKKKVNENHSHLGLNANENHSHLENQKKPDSCSWYLMPKGNQSNREKIKECH